MLRPSRRVETGAYVGSAVNRSGCSHGSIRVDDRDVRMVEDVVRFGLPFELLTVAADGTLQGNPAFNESPSPSSGEIFLGLFFVEFGPEGAAGHRVSGAKRP